MTAAGYLPLPVDADEGFPQAFRFLLAGVTYTATLTVTVVEEELLIGGAPLELPRPGAFLVLAVTREAPGEPRVVLRRKLVPGLALDGPGLSVLATTMLVDPRNLGAPGAYGSKVEVGVLARWAS